MFCRNCGYRANEGAKYCSNCGDKVNSEMPNSSYEEINILKHQIIPKFNLLYVFLSNISIPFLFFLGLLINDGRFLVLLIAAILIFIYAFIRTIINVLQYSSLKYDFYNNKLEYVDGFFNKEEKSVKYDNISEVVMNKSFFERLFGLGTIRILTNASVLDYRKSYQLRQTNGIYIRSIRNVENEYQIIKSIIDKRY